MKSETRVFAAREIIFNEGDPSTGVYLIQEGRVEIFRKHDEITVVLGLLKQGDLIGTLTLMSKAPRSASARAITQCVLGFYPIEKLTESFKEIPIWAQAALKDTIARVKYVNDRLIEAKTLEKELQKMVGSIYHHTAQISFLLALLIRKSSLLTEENTSILPIKDFLINAEFILQRKYSYLEAIFNEFKINGLIRIQKNQKHGEVIYKANPQLIEDFGNFCLEVFKKGTDSFIPQKYYPWMNAIIRISRNNNASEKFLIGHLIELLNTELTRKDGKQIIEDSLKARILTLDKGEISFVSKQIQRKIIFESMIHSIKKISS